MTSVDGHRLCVSVGQENNDAAINMGILADNRRIKGEGDNLRKALLDDMGTSIIDGDFSR